MQNECLLGKAYPLCGVKPYCYDNDNILSTVVMMNAQIQGAVFIGTTPAHDVFLTLKQI